MKESKLFKSLMATCVVIIFGGPAVVLADTPSYEKDAKATVSYADLNLEREEGVRELYRRLQYASRQVCRETSPMISDSIVRRACYRRALSNAIDEFDNEDLARIHAR